MDNEAKYQIGEKVNFPLVDKWPADRHYIVVGCERKSGKFVYHLAVYDFDKLAFQTRSHVPEEILRSCTAS